VSTRTTGELRTLNAPAIPTSNPSESKYVSSETADNVERRDDEDMLTSLFSRVRALVRRAQSLTRM
jgi:hypothetical protein